MIVLRAIAYNSLQKLSREKATRSPRTITLINGWSRVWRASNRELTRGRYLDEASSGLPRNLNMRNNILRNRRQIWSDFLEVSGAELGLKDSTHFIASIDYRLGQFELSGEVGVGFKRTFDSDRVKLSSTAKINVQFDTFHLKPGLGYTLGFEGLRFPFSRLNWRYTISRLLDKEKTKFLRCQLGIPFSTQLNGPEVEISVGAFQLNPTSALSIKSLSKSESPLIGYMGVQVQPNRNIQKSLKGNTLNTIFSHEITRFLPRPKTIPSKRSFEEGPYKGVVPGPGFRGLQPTPPFGTPPKIGRSTGFLVLVIVVSAVISSVVTSVIILITLNWRKWRKLFKSRMD